MSKLVTEQEAAAMLIGADRVAILCHKNPDGDTTGCGFAVYYGLKYLGKQVMVCCSDPFSKKYDYFTCETESFTPDFVLNVDVADEKLLGDGLRDYVGRCDLCLDHHPSNTGYARHLCLRENYGAACELVYDILGLMGVPIEGKIADSLYTGLATDTGCFRYSNTGVHTLRTAADLVAAGANSAAINTVLFETKSRSRLKVEQMALSSLEFFHEGRCAVMTVTLDMLKESGATNEELEGVAGIPRQIEGVDVGITFRQQGTAEERRYKVSVRTSEQADASALCRRFSGGGHARAAGCEFRDMDLSAAKEQIVTAAGEILKELTL